MDHSIVMPFEDFGAWKQAKDLVKEFYSLSRQAELARDFGLRDQIQRAAVSSMTHLAEDFERTGTQEKLHFYNIARSSCGEVRSLLHVVEDNFSQLAPHTADLRVSAINAGKLISGLIASTHRRTAIKVSAAIGVLALPIFHILSTIYHPPPFPH